MRIDVRKCDRGDCDGLCEWNRQCAAYVCINCDTHIALERCFCGWSRHGDDGRKELEDMGETIDPEPELAPAVEFTESSEGYEARNRWAEHYDDLNGAPEGEWDR